MYWEIYLPPNIISKRIKFESLLQKCLIVLLQGATNYIFHKVRQQIYNYKVRQVLLQIAISIAKINDYFKAGQSYPNVTRIGE